MVEEPKTATEVSLEEKNKEVKNSLLVRLVPPHGKVSREVTETDIPKVIEDSKILHALCFYKNGPYYSAYAIAHPQIDNVDPLRFFVTADRQIIINPVITRHSGYMVDSKEGCYTFAHLPPKINQRWRKVEVDYITIMVDPTDDKKFALSSVIHEELKGTPSFVMQHETNHLDGNYIYSY